MITLTNVTPTDERAYAYASGEVVFATEQPPGTLPCPEVPRDQIEVSAVRGYDGVYRVPGVPSAQNDNAALKAFIAWCDWITQKTSTNQTEP